LTSPALGVDVTGLGLLELTLGVGVLVALEDWFEALAVSDGLKNILKTTTPKTAKTAIDTATVAINFTDPLDF